MKDLTIAKAAREAGVGVETIRFYERRGLIEQPQKPRRSGFRTYSLELIKRIKFIRQAQQIGFSLHEIQELLSLKADPKADCSAVRGQAVAKLDQVKRKIEQLHRIGDALDALIAACPGRGAIETCTILDTLAYPSQGPVPPMKADKPRPTKSGDPAVHKSKRRYGNAPSRAKEHDVKSVTLNIQGMHCDGCASTIKALIEREAGVKSVMVSFENGEARMLFDPLATSEDKLVALIERPGYRVTNRAS